MNKVQPRILLYDPIINKSSLVIDSNKLSLSENFIKKFSFINFIINILLPIMLLIFILFMAQHIYNDTIKNKNKKLNNLRDDVVPLSEEDDEYQ